MITDENTPALVVLAAGLGSRYGGYKQLEGVGTANEPIMELSIQDAIKTGFQKIVLVTNDQIEKEIDAQLISKYQEQVAICQVLQRLDDLPEPFRLPPNRQKPWGTGHAIFSARNAVDTPFAVINADDFYGRSAFRLMSQALSRLPNDSNEYLMVGYRLENTLSEHGGVSRGLCNCSGAYLTSLKEVVNIRRTQDTIIGEYKGEEVQLSPDSIVSMNFWGFSAQVFGLLRQQFIHFLETHIGDDKSEFFITDALDDAIKEGEGKVNVKTTNEKWYGVTFREDRDQVRKGIQDYLMNIKR